MKASFYPSFFALLFIVLALSACGSSPEANMPPAPFIKFALVSPPEPLDEYAVKPANPRYEIWRPGYWSYDDGAYAWEPGGLMARPEPTAVWAADHWEQRAYGWAFIPGHWR